MNGSSQERIRAGGSVTMNLLPAQSAVTTDDGVWHESSTTVTSECVSAPGRGGGGEHYHSPRRGSATGEPRRGGPPARTSSAAAGHWPAVSHPQLRSCRSWPAPAVATLSYLGHVSEEERSRRLLEVFNPLLLHISIKHGSGAESKNLSQIFCWSCDEITFCFAVKVLLEDYDESMMLCNLVRESDRRVGSGSLAITLWGLLNTDC